jgi:SAM-dependent methyltransferase
MDNDDIIGSARKRFDGILHTDDYKKVHSDSEHLENLIGLVEIKDRGSYLDIGTGNGYIAFELARRNQNIKVYGLDIAKNSTVTNNLIKEIEGLKNIRFDSYDGKEFPYVDGAFCGAVSRYAFHHFPDAGMSLTELGRTVGNSGFFLLSDPLTYDEDEDDFADAFQSLVNDGHVHFYRRPEIEDLFRKHDFAVEKEFDSYVRYPREMNEDYQRLFDMTDGGILEKYRIEILESKVFITAKVMNILFRYSG